ncbi:MAG: hypothetical protein AVDCRST_MAG33-3107, partial [uncultured Thermomicrobiales bacterium]
GETPTSPRFPSTAHPRGSGPRRSRVRRGAPVPHAAKRTAPKAETERHRGRGSRFGQTLPSLGPV